MGMARWAMTMTLAVGGAVLAAPAQTRPATDFPGPANASSQPAPGRGKALFVAWWNVENLFDTVDDPAVEGDEEFIPEGPKAWDARRLDRKCSRLGEILKRMNAKSGPDLFGVCEVENRMVVERLAKELKPLGRDYQVVHHDSPSERGIDVALVYDAGKLKLLNQEFHKVENLRTREIVQAEFATLPDGKRLHVFGNHWPSRGNAESFRMAAAQTLRKRVDELLARDPAADIVILGDLNDYSDNDSLTKGLRTGPDGAAHPQPTADGKSERLFDAMAEIRAAKGGDRRGSYVFDNQWNYLDHVILSAGLFDDQGFRLRPGSAGEMKFKEMLFVPNNPEMSERPSRTFSGNTYHDTGYSDHLPVGVILDY